MLIKEESHECCVQIKPKIVCPKLKQIKFKNQHKQQEANNVIFSDIECYMKGTDEKFGSNTYKRYLNMHLLLLVIVGIADTNQGTCFADHTLIQTVKEYVRDLLEVETKHSIKINKAMLFTEEDKLYHDANDMSHL